MTALIFYAFAFGPALALRLLQHFLAVAPDMFLRPAAAVPSTLGHPGQPSVSEQLLAQMEDPAQVEALAERLRTDPGFAAQYAAQVERALVGKGAAPPPPPPDPQPQPSLWARRHQGVRAFFRRLFA